MFSIIVLRYENVFLNVIWFQVVVVEIDCVIKCIVDVYNYVEDIWIYN